VSEIHEEPQEAAAELPVPQEAAAAQLPGRFLRAAREARSLSVFEVAQSLKFSPRQIEALEADDFAVLPPGATFQRGFVRGYAKLLKLDPEPLLAMLDVRAPVALPDVREPQNMGVAATPVAAGRRSSTPMLLGSAVLAVVAAALAVWHFLGLQPAPMATKPSTDVTANGEAAAVRPPDIRIEEAPVAVPPAQAPAGPPSADMHQLVFEFQDKSWVEVRDASQRIIFSGENLPGSRQVVAGKPPFQLVIGNAAKVNLQYDDSRVDLTPHIRAEVARLTLE